MIFDLDKKIKQPNVRFDKISEEIDFSKSYKEDANLLDDDIIPESARYYLDKITRAGGHNTSPQTSVRQDQAYVTSLPVLQSLLGKINYKNELPKSKEIKSTIETNIHVSKDDSRYKNGARAKSTFRQRLQILPKLLQYNAKEKV